VSCSGRLTAKFCRRVSIGDSDALGEDLRRERVFLGVRVGDDPRAGEANATGRDCFVGAISTASSAFAVAVMAAEAPS
jgi:hypothetical protein